MDKKLTPKQKKFVDKYTDCGNASEAARQAGYSEKTAGEIGYENLKKPEIRTAIQERMDQARITEPRLLKVLDEGLEATVVKIATHEGSITDERSFTDFVTRHKYLETALKLRNMFPAEKQEVTGEIIVTTKPPKDLDENRL